MRWPLCQVLALGCASRPRGLPKAAQKSPIYVTGAFRNNCGISQGARLYAEEMERLGRKVFRIDVTTEMRQKDNFDFKGYLISPEQAAAYGDRGKIIIHANPPLFYLALKAFPPTFLRNNQLTAFWAFEGKELPSFWKPAFSLVDSIETPSSFSAGILKAFTCVPVKSHPHFMLARPTRKTSFAPDGIARCLYVFDGGASFARKNPEAVLDAFLGANIPAAITFKISNANPPSRELDTFLKRCAKVPECRVITEDLTEAEMTRLYLEHDIYLSLHKSEGYGLTIAEAYSLGLKVLATDHGGNTEFLPPASLVPVKTSSRNYPEPDIAAASRMLRALGLKLLAKSGKDSDFPFSNKALCL